MANISLESRKNQILREIQAEEQRRKQAEQKLNRFEYKEKKNVEPSKSLVKSKNQPTKTVEENSSNHHQIKESKKNHEKNCCSNKSKECDGTNKDCCRNELVCVSKEEKKIQKQELAVQKRNEKELIKAEKKAQKEASKENRKTQDKSEREVGPLFYFFSIVAGVLLIGLLVVVALGIITSWKFWVK